MAGGPQPLERTQKLAIAQEIADRARELYGNELQAIGLYGSTGRGTDGPYSDTELFCVLKHENYHKNYRWIGQCKIEVKFIGAARILARAAEVEWDWPLTHGRYFQSYMLYDPDNFLAELQRAVSTQPEEKFREAMYDGIIVDGIYEHMGKLRNAHYQKNHAFLPLITIDLAISGAYLIGLAHRQCYSTRARVLEESLKFARQPDGYRDLCELVIGGDFRDVERVVACGETFWLGVERWAEEDGFRIESENAFLLSKL